MVKAFVGWLRQDPELLREASERVGEGGGEEVDERLLLNARLTVVEGWWEES